MGPSNPLENVEVTTSNLSTINHLPRILPSDKDSKTSRMEKTKHFLFVTVLVMTLLFVDSAVEARADVEAVEALDSVEQPEATMIEVDRSDCSGLQQLCGPGLADCCEGFSCYYQVTGVQGFCFGV